MPHPGEQYLIRPRLSRPQCQLLYRELNPTRELLKFPFGLVPFLLLYLVPAFGTCFRRVREAAATLAEKIGDRRPGVPYRLDDCVNHKLDRRVECLQFLLLLYLISPLRTASFISAPLLPSLTPCWLTCFLVLLLLYIPHRGSAEDRRRGLFVPQK